MSPFFTNNNRQQQSQSRNQATKEQRTAEAKTAFTDSLISAGSYLNTKLQSRAKDIHDNSHTLARQEEGLGRDTKDLEKQNEEMKKFLETSGKELEEFDDCTLSDVEHNFDADLALIEETLRLAEEGDFSDEDELADAPDCMPNDKSQVDSKSNETENTSAAIETDHKTSP